MRILQVLPFSYSQPGGVAVHVRNISERLAKRHDVTVFAANDKGRQPTCETINGVKIRRFRCYAPSDAYMFSIDMPLEMRRSEFDVVHGHGYHDFPLHFSPLVRNKLFIATPHFHGVGHSPFRNALITLTKPIGKVTLRKANAIVAVSDFEKSLICQIFGLDRNKVNVIPNGVDFNEFEGLMRRNHDGRSVLYVGYLAHFKGAQYLVEVLPRLPEDVVLQVVGEGPMKPVMQKRASQLGVSDRVNFHSNVPRRELLQMYADADVFALPSRYEAYSIVVAEALAAKTRCVITRTSALTEWEDGITCFGVDFPINLNKLAERIMFAMERSHCNEDFKKWYGHKILDWNLVAERVEKLYKSN
jgi:glycosyltransferase involved in cell wall biosynthesis